MSRDGRIPRVTWRKLPKRLAISAAGFFLCWYTLFKGGSVVPELLAIGFFAMAVVPLFFVYADWINGGNVEPPPADDG